MVYLRKDFFTPILCVGGVRATCEEPILTPGGRILQVFLINYPILIHPYAITPTNEMETLMGGAHGRRRWVPGRWRGLYSHDERRLSLLVAGFPHTELISVWGSRFSLWASRFFTIRAELAEKTASFEWADFFQNLLWGEPKWAVDRTFEKSPFFTRSRKKWKCEPISRLSPKVYQV